MSNKSKQEMNSEIELTIQHLNRNYITLHDKDVKKYGFHFREVMSKLLDSMKEKDTLFKATYQELCGAGSFYDGLKVGKPTEFDMDIIIKLPISYSEIMIENENVPPAFTKVKITKAMDLLRQHPRWTSDYRCLDNWRDKDGYLLQTKFRQWMEAVVNKALNELPLVDDNNHELVVTSPEYFEGSPELVQEIRYLITLKKSGPAMTFQITIPDMDNQKIDVDVVPVIEFKHPQWPPAPVRQLPPIGNGKKERTSWFIVPKPRNKAGFEDTHWRLAFHHQERDIIHGKGALKPVCRLLKKMRDTLGLYPIASYYIKTVFLWEVLKQKESTFWNKRQGLLFLHMLKKLAESIKLGRIDYYWDKRYNLLEGITELQTTPFSNRLFKVIKNLEIIIYAGPEKDLKTDPLIMVKYLLNKSELGEYNTRTSLHIESESRESSGDEIQESRKGSGYEVRDGHQKLVQPGPDLQDGLQRLAQPESALAILHKIQAEVTDNKKLIKQLLDKVTILEKNLSNDVEMRITCSCFNPLY